MDKVVHFEIPFDNKQRAMKFYTDTFGWQLMDMPQMSYVMARTTDVDAKQMPKQPGAINGGMFQRPQEAPYPTIYLNVNSIDEALKRVAAAGGRVVTPNTPIPGMGAYARVADTEGNIIGVFQTQPAAQQPSQKPRRASRPRARAATRSKPRQAARGRAKKSKR
jgi:predicted enzyme related to lactoylglutathione lyase